MRICRLSRLSRSRVSVKANQEVKLRVVRSITRRGQLRGDVAFQDGNTEARSTFSNLSFNILLRNEGKKEDSIEK